MNEGIRLTGFLRVKGASQVGYERLFGVIRTQCIKYKIAWQKVISFAISFIYSDSLKE